MSKWKFVLLFLFLLAFRTTFSLYTPPVQPGIDELQTYLIGLKYYTTSDWPYFGPDVNGAENPGFNSQIPGALEGLLIGLPFHLLPIPETPFILAALLSTLGAALLAWYIHKRFPNLSLHWLFLWICITPWGLFEGAHVVNPAFIFLPSVLFFIGFMETIPAFSLKWLKSLWSNAFMGFSLLWVMQFHFSYVYLLPLAAFSILIQARNSTVIRFFYKPSPLGRGFEGTQGVFPVSAVREMGRVRGVLHRGKSPSPRPSPLKGEGENWKCLLYFFAGALPMLALIIPTFIKYGLMRSNVASGFTVPFNWDNVIQGPVILARFLSLVCFELPRFLGSSTSDRVGYLTSHPFLTLPGFLLWGIGLLQPAALLVYWFKKKYASPGWQEMKWLLLALFLLVWVSFWFTDKKPASHIYVCFFPWLMFYSCYIWNGFATQPKWKLAAKIFLGIGLYFQVGYALTYPRQYSIYTQREQMAKAIQEKNYHLLGERRTPSFY